MWKSGHQSHSLNALWSQSGDRSNVHDGFTATTELPGSSYTAPASAASLNGGEPDTRMQSLRELYEMRFQTLSTTIREGYSMILSDGLLKTMKEDPVSDQFVHQRIQELFEKIVFSEREVIIDQLSSQYASLKAQFSAQDLRLRKELEQRETEIEESANVISRLKEEAHRERQQKLFFESELALARESASQIQEKLNDQLLQQTQKFQERFNQESNEISKLIEECQLLQEAIQQCELEKQSVSQEAATIVEEFQIFRQEFNELEVKNTTLSLDYAVASETIAMNQKTIERTRAELESTLNQLRKANENHAIAQKEIESKTTQLNELDSVYKIKYSSLENELNESNSKQQKQKSKHREKVQSLKEQVEEITSRNKELDTLLSQIKQQLKDTNTALKTSEENKERENQDLQASYEDIFQIERAKMTQIIQENERKHEEHVKELEKQFQQTMQQQIEYELEDLRASESQLRVMLDEKLSMLQHDYISKEQHDSIIGQKAQAIASMRTEFDAVLDQFKQNEKNKFTSDLSSIETKHILEITFFKRNLSEAEEQMKKLKQQVSALEASNQKFEGMAAKTQIENEARVREMREIQNELARKDAKLAKLKTKVQTLELSRNEFQDASNSLRSNYEASKLLAESLESQKARLADDLMSTRQQFEECKAEYAQAKREMQNLKVSIENHASFNSYKDEVIEAFKKQVSDLKAENLALSSQFFEIYNQRNHRNVDDERKLQEIHLKLQQDSLEIEEKNYQLDQLRTEIISSTESRRQLEEQIHQLRSELIQKERDAFHSTRDHSNELNSRTLHSNELQREKAKSNRIRSILLSELKSLKNELVNIQEYVHDQVRRNEDQTKVFAQTIADRSNEVFHQQSASINNYFESSLSAAEHQFTKQMSEFQDTRNKELKDISIQASQLEQVNQTLLTENKNLRSENFNFKQICSTFEEQNAHLAKQFQENLTKLQSLESVYETRISDYSNQRQEQEQKERQAAQKQIEEARQETLKWKGQFQSIESQNKATQSLLQSTQQLEKESRDVIIQLEETITKSKQERIQYESAREQIQKELNEAKKNITQTNNSLSHLKKQFDNSLQESEILRKENDALQAELAKMKLTYQEHILKTNLEVVDLHSLLVSKEGNSTRRSDLSHIQSEDSRLLTQKATNDLYQLKKKPLQLENTLNNYHHLNSMNVLLPNSRTSQQSNHLNSKRINRTDYNTTQGGMSTYHSNTSYINLSTESNQIQAASPLKISQSVKSLHQMPISTIGSKHGKDFRDYQFTPKSLKDQEQILTTQSNSHHKNYERFSPSTYFKPSLKLTPTSSLLKKDK